MKCKNLILEAERFCCGESVVPGSVSVGKVLFYGRGSTDEPRSSETLDVLWRGSGLRGTAPSDRLGRSVGRGGWIDCKAGPTASREVRVPRLSPCANFKLIGGGLSWRRGGTTGEWIRGRSWIPDGRVGVGPPFERRVCRPRSGCQGAIKGLRVRIAWTAKATAMTAGRRVTSIENRIPRRNERTPRLPCAVGHRRPKTSSAIHPPV